MALFKFRKGGDEPATTARQPESAEVLRRRAKNRLIGSAILVLIGVVGFPLLVDKQPRPVSVDLPIEIPDRAKVLPLPAPVVAPAAVATPPVAAPGAGASAPVATASAPAAAGKPAGKAPVAKPEPKPPAKPAADKKVDTKKAETKAAAAVRYVVQVGSFADQAHARDVRHRLDRAGLKNYTQAIETRDGRRIRVRVGPFGSKAEAERAADKIKKLDLPASVLSL